MDPARPFVVINCLAQGHAVAGPAEAPGDDLEMVMWGMARDKALGLRDKLNRQAGKSGPAPAGPQHRHD